MATPGLEKQYCNTCKVETRHRPIKVHKTSFQFEDWYHQSDTWGIWQCLGCDTVHFKMTSMNSEDFDPDGTYAVTTEYFPKPERATKKEYHELPYLLTELYRETIETFNNDNLILCSAGLRTLLEGICKDQMPEQRGTLQTRIEGLKSIIPATIVDNLHSFRFLGNAAVHELARPSQKELALAIEVMEDILNVLYSLNYKSARLFQLIERRTKK